jgi:TRAP-type C4-dicarboxylate transport system permease large subunit
MAMALVGRLRGSLGHVSIITNFVLAGVSGSAVADAVASGKPLSRRCAKKARRRICGCGDRRRRVARPDFAAVDTMVVYAQISNQSVVKLFMAV